MIEFTAPHLTAPDSSIIGVIEEGSGSLRASTHTVRLGPGDPMPDLPGNYILDHALSRSGTVAKSMAVARLLQLRREGATIALVSHDEPLLEICADEIWWIREGDLVARGDPSEVLTQYHRHVAETLHTAGAGGFTYLSPTMRYGDGRARLEQVELLDAKAAPSTVFRGGEEMSIRVSVRFVSPVADPVIGIMIRTRIGLNVYGTNTELEQLRPGPVEAESVVRVTYRFRCTLCPGEYTVTAASHDPDGLWHDWMEDAVGFSVFDSRYTAGVANLKATVEFERIAAR
jgi:lipopolysaccharide transport system ATP-binding protein